MVKKLAQENGWLYLPICKPPKQVLLKIAESIFTNGKSDPRYKTCKSGTLIEIVDILSGLIESSGKKIIVALDEIHGATGISCSTYHLLMRATDNILFITIATEPYIEKTVTRPENKRFFWELNDIEVFSLDDKESTELAEEFFDKYKIDDKSHINRIVRNSNGNPLAIENSVRLLARGEPEIKNDKMAKDGAINLFPLVLMFLVSLVALRYLFRGMQDYEMASLSSFVGLMSMFAVRYLGKLKKS